MSMKLVILGLLMEGEKHPYEIQLIMKRRNMDKYINFQKGSLYYAFDALCKKGLIEVSEVVRDSNRPDRTVHRITDLGREEFEQLLYEQFGKLETYYDPIYAALAFAQYADEEKIAAILEHNIKIQEIILDHMQQLLTEYEARLNRASLYTIKGGIEHGEAKLKWLRKVQKDARKGRLTEKKGLPMEDEMPFKPRKAGRKHKPI